MADEIYNVNLLGLVPFDFKGDLGKAETALAEYAEIMRLARMNVEYRLRKEDEVPIAVWKRFKRFYYDDLSFREHTPLPPEINTLSVFDTEAKEASLDI